MAVSKVLEATEIPAQVRGAAARALFRMDDEAATQQILRVSTLTANPKLRVVFEKIVSGAEDDELGRDLDALEFEEKKSYERQ